jgi:hypothetical protein
VKKPLLASRLGDQRTDAACAAPALKARVDDPDETDARRYPSRHRRGRDRQLDRAKRAADLLVMRDHRPGRAALLPIRSPYGCRSDGAGLGHNVGAGRAHEAYVKPGSIPFDFPDGFVFTVTPPWQADLAGLKDLPDLPLGPLPPEMPLCRCFFILVTGEHVGRLSDFGFTLLIEGEKLLPDAPTFIPNNPAVFVARLCGVAPEAVRYVRDQIKSVGPGDDYEELVAFNIRNGRKLTDTDLKRMRGAAP